MSAVRRCSSSRPRGSLRCVERCCPSAAQARRSETCSCARTCSMQARRRAGLRSFPGQPPAECAYPASDRKPPCAAGCSRAQGPSGASPARSLARRTPGATDNTSPRSRRSGGLRPPCSGPVRPKHRPAATSRRSLQACIASLPLQSSLMSKTYLKSDYFNGGGSPLLTLSQANAQYYYGPYRRHVRRVYRRAYRRAYYGGYPYSYGGYYGGYRPYSYGGYGVGYGGYGGYGG